MPIVSQSCPSCGAALPGTGDVRVCTYCGSEWRVTDLSATPPSTSAGTRPALDRKPAAKPLSKAKKWAIIGGLVVAMVIGIVFLRVYASNRLSYYRTINAAALSPDGKLLASIHGQGLETSCTLRVWDAATGAELHRFAGVDSPMWVVYWSPDGRWIATGGQTGKIQLWDTTNWQPARLLEGTAGFTKNLAWSPDSRWIASGDDHGVLRVWDAASAQLTFNEPVHTNTIESLAWSPDGKLLATGSWDNSAQIIDPVAGKVLQHFDDKSYVSCVAWSPDGKRLATGGLSNTLNLFDVTSGTKVWTMAGPANSITALAWSPDGKEIASTDNGQTLRLWDVATGKPLRVLDNHGYDANVRWSSDGAQVASGSDGIVRIWDAASGQLHELRGHERDSRIVVVAWSADNKQLITLGSYDNSLRVWDIAGQRATNIIKIPRGEAFWHALF